MTVKFTSHVLNGKKVLQERMCVRIASINQQQNKWHQWMKGGKSDSDNVTDNMATMNDEILIW